MNADMHPPGRTPLQIARAGYECQSGLSWVDAPEDVRRSWVEYAEMSEDLCARVAWAKHAAKAHGWPDDALPLMADGRFVEGWHEADFQTFLAGVRHGRS